MEHADFKGMHQAMAKKHEQVKSDHEGLHKILAKLTELMKGVK